MKKISLLLVALVAVLAISCSGNASKIKAIFDDATEQIQKAENPEAAQKIFDDTKTKVLEIVKNESVSGSDSEGEELTVAAQKFAEEASKKLENPDSFLAVDVLMWLIPDK